MKKSLFKKLGSLITRNQTPPTGHPLTAEQISTLNIFTQNIKLFQTISTENEQSQLFKTVLAQFNETFDSINYDQLRNPQVVEALSDFCYISANNGSIILEDIEYSKLMFDSILFIFHMLSYLPHDVDFISLFNGVIHVSKHLPEILTPAYDIITIMFRSEKFYDLFVENDGYTLVFTSFYIKCISKDSQEFFNKLFFESIPKEFHKQIPPSPLLSLFHAALSNEAEPPKMACAEFISKFLILSHQTSDQTIFDRFNEINGLAAMNRYFIEYNQIPECAEIYKQFIIESNSDPCIITNLYKLYRDQKADPHLRTFIINLLSASLDNVFSFDKLNEVVPIHLWILYPPELDQEGLIMLTIFLKGLSEKRMYSIKPALDGILKIIQPPGNVKAPIDSFLELIETAIMQQELKTEELIGKKFLEDFILIPTVEDVALYFEKHVLFGSVVASVYSSELANDYRYPIIRKFIEVSQFLTNMKDFIEFLATLFTRHFSSQIVSLLLNFLNNADLANLLAQELTKRPLGFKYFMESNGFLSIEDFLRENDHEYQISISPEESIEIISKQKSKGEIVIRILGALSAYGPKREINEWINEQPVYSPIFKIDKKILEQAIYAFKHDTTFIHVPSLLPFAQTFDCSLMINLYLAGKFAVKSFKKFHKPIKKIPNYKLIADRYVYPEDVETFLNLKETLINLAMPHYTVYQFVPFLEKASLGISFYPFIFFSFNFPHLSVNSTPLVKINRYFTIVVDNDQLSFKNTKTGETDDVSICANKWYRVVLNYNSVKKKMSILIDSHLLTAFHFDDENVSVIFGDDSECLKSYLMISGNILVSEKPLNSFDFVWRLPLMVRPKELSNAAIQKTSSVYSAYYLGLASYFEHFIDLEIIFAKMEKCESIDHFYYLYDLLIRIQIVNLINYNRFIERLFLTLKRKHELIQDDLTKAFLQFPTQYFQKGIQKSKLMLLLLNEYELYFIFPIDSLVALLLSISNELNYDIDIDAQSTSSVLQNLIILIRTGIDERLIKSLLPIIKFFILKYPTFSKYRFFLNSAISSFEWNEKKIDYTYSNFNVNQLLNKPMPSNKISCYLLESFINIVQSMPEIELYNYKELLQFMLLFDDDRSLFFADLISMYSNRNPKFVTDSVLAIYIFSKNCDSIRFWIRAFSILSSEQSAEIVPSSIIIKRPVFLPVVIEMLSNLCSKLAVTALLNSEEKNPNENLIRQVFDILLTLPSDDYRYFLQSSCQIPLMKLENLGMIPNTIQAALATSSNEALNEDGQSSDLRSRVPIHFPHFQPTKLSREEIKSAFGLCDRVSPFTNQILKHEMILNSMTSNITTKNELPDNVDNNDWIESLYFRTSLMNLFTNILFSCEPSNFGSYLFELASGHSLMYDSYSHYFGQELVFTVLIRMTISDFPLELYHKPLFKLIVKCVKNSLFRDRYVHFLSLVFNLMKSLQVKKEFESILSDPFIMNCYRELILGGFIFLSGADLIELFQLFTTYKAVVFYQPLFSKVDFALYWIHMTRLNELDNQDVIMCMKLLMSMFDQPIINEYKKDEIGVQWKLYKQKFVKNELETSDYALRSKRAKSIITQSSSAKYDIAKQNLIISVYRVSNLYIQSNSQLFGLNIRNRNYEMNMYKMTQITRTFLLKSTYFHKSFHLAPNPMPLNQSAAVLPSPFKIKSPEFNQKVSHDFFMIEKEVSPSRIKQINEDGKLLCAPEWHHFHSSEMFTSPFEYSHIIRKCAILPQLQNTFSRFGPYVAAYNVDFLYYTHPIPCVLLVGEKSLLLLILARVVNINPIAEHINDIDNENNSMNEDNTNDSNNDTENDYTNYSVGGVFKHDNIEIELIEQPQFPISYLPFAESVTLNEWSHTSLFCGHIILFLDLDRIMNINSYLYLHKFCGLNISSMFDPPIIIVFQNQNETESFKKLLSKISTSKIVDQLPAYPFLATINGVQKAEEMWINGLLSNYQYLLLLNYFGGRSFSDLSQYPVFPWVISPSLENNRDLSLPMGQLDSERAEHYQSTYENSKLYFYGCHYSQPAVVSWLLLRLPPFIYFQWDLNNGWDNSQRLFVSIKDAYSNASETNHMDLKELIPAMYTVPEIFVNNSNLEFPNSAIENISLPDWSNKSPHHYVETMRKYLETSTNLNKWIDLIFGYKQQGEAAIQAKNVFLPTSYHSSSPESLDMDPIVFETQVNNFGQCPIQLFVKKHPYRIHSKQNMPILYIDSIKGFDVEMIGSRSRITFSPTSLPAGSQSPQPSITKHRSMTLKNLPLTAMIASTPSFFSLTKDSSDVKFVTPKSTSSTPFTTSEPMLLSTQSNNNYSAVSMTSMYNNSNNCFNRTVAFCDSGAFTMPGISESIPPMFNYYISIDPVYSTCQLMNKSEKRPILFNYNCKYAFCTHLSIGSTGLFAVTSFSNGYVQIDKIIHKLKNPISLEPISFFSMPLKCTFSVIFSIDFICASLYICDQQRGQVISRIPRFNMKKRHSITNSMSLKNEIRFSTNKKKSHELEFQFNNETFQHPYNIIYLWNYSTKLLHRVIKLDTHIIGMISDDNESLLTVYGRNDIIQYTLNAVKVRQYHTDYDITVAKLFPYSSTFDGRFIVTGDTQGYLTFLGVPDYFDLDDTATNESFNTFRVIGSRSVHKHPIVSLFVSVSRMSIVSVDTRGHIFLTKLDLNGCQLVNIDAHADQVLASDSNPSIASSKSQNISPISNQMKIKSFKSSSSITDDASIAPVKKNPGNSETSESNETKRANLGKASSSFIAPLEMNLDQADDLTCQICNKKASGFCKECKMPLCMSCVDDTTQLCPQCTAKKNPQQSE